MTTLTEEQINENLECPMDNIGFDPNTIDGRGEIEEEETEN